MPQYSKSKNLSTLEVENATREAYEKYNGALNSYLSASLNSSQEVEDLLQEVYLRFIQHIKPNVKPSFSFLRKIASNLLIDHFRRRRVREWDSHISADDVDLSSAMASPEQILESKQMYMLFKHVIEKVRPNSRKAFTLHRFKGLTYDEVANEMGISRNMVKKHISHVMLQFRKKLVKTYEHQK